MGHMQDRLCKRDCSTGKKVAGGNCSVLGWETLLAARKMPVVDGIEFGALFTWLYGWD